MVMVRELQMVMVRELQTVKELQMVMLAVSGLVKVRIKAKILVMFFSLKPVSSDSFIQ